MEKLGHDFADENKVQVIHQEKVLHALKTLRSRLGTGLNDDYNECEIDVSRSTFTRPQLRSRVDEALVELSTAIGAYTDTNKAKLRKLRLRSFRHVSLIGVFQRKESFMKTRVRQLEEELALAKNKLIECGVACAKEKNEDLLLLNDDRFHREGKDVVAEQSETRVPSENLKLSIMKRGDELLPDADDDGKNSIIPSARQRTFAKLRTSFNNFRKVGNRRINRHRPHDKDIDFKEASDHSQQLEPPIIRRGDKHPPSNDDDDDDASSVVSNSRNRTFTKLRTSFNNLRKVGNRHVNRHQTQGNGNDYEETLKHSQHLEFPIIKRGGTLPPDTDDDDEEGSSITSSSRTKISTKLRASFNNLRKKIDRYVNHTRTQNFLIALIIINSITMGINTFDFVTTNPDMEARFNSLDLGFLVIFTVELILQFIVFGVYMFRDGWNVFDFVVITSSWIGEAIGGSGNASVVRSFRAFRVLRAFRLVPRVRIMRELVTTLVRSFARMTAIFGLLLLIFYIFAVYFTSLFAMSINDDDENLTLSFKQCGFDGIPRQVDYFTRLDHSLLALLQLMTLDNWVVMSYSLNCLDSLSSPSFFVFIVITNFIFINLVIAVICDAAPREHEGPVGYKGRRRHNKGPDGVSLETQLEDRLYEMTEVIQKIMQVQKDTQNKLSCINCSIGCAKQRNLNENDVLPIFTEAKDHTIQSQCQK